VKSYSVGDYGNCQNISFFFRGTKFYGQSIVCLNRTAKLFWFFFGWDFFFHFLFIFGKIYNKMWVFCFCFCKKTWEIIIFWRRIWIERVAVVTGGEVKKNWAYCQGSLARLQDWFFKKKNRGDYFLICTKQKFTIFLKKKLTKNC